MPQLETYNILFDFFSLMINNICSLAVIGYSTCSTASCYYNTIAKYIINIHCSLNYFMKIK